MSTHWTFDALRIVEPLASFVTDIAAKGTVILLLALFATWTLRRSSAAMRHAVWLLTMFMLLLLPAVSWVLPPIAIPILPQIEEGVVLVDVGAEGEGSEPSPQKLNSGSSPTASTASVPAVSPSVMTSLAAEQQAATNVPPEVAVVPTEQLVRPGFGSQPLATEAPKVLATDIPALFISIVWALGVVSFATYVALCVVKAAVLRRQSEAVTTGVWNRLLAELTQRLRLRRAIERCEHPEPVVPLTLGVLRAVVLLPQIGREWPEPMKRTVLLHELAHVRRRDVACQLLGRMACTLFWFHPFAWYGLRRLRQEGEQACDDAVVRSGERASDYADQLLQVAQFCCEPRGLSPGLAMAEGSSLEVRVKSMFDKTRSHEPIRKSSFSILLLFGTITLAAVSSVRPVAGTVVAADSSFDPPAELSDEVKRSASAEPVLARANPDEADKIVTEEMQPVTSRELTGVWQGVTKDFGVLIQFIGRESRLNGKGPVHSGKWIVHVPRRGIGSALEFKDDSETGVVDIEFSGFDTTTDESVRTSVGRIERGRSGRLYLTVLTSKRLPKYPSVRRLRLKRVSNDQAISRELIDQFRAAEAAFKNGKPAEVKSGVSISSTDKATPQSSQARSPWLSVPAEWKTKALNRIVDLCPEFGPEHDGLKLGIARPTGQTVFRMGDRIPIELFVMNVSSQEKTFQFRCAPRISYAPRVVNAKGQVVRGISGTMVFQPPYSVELKPGEACSIPASGLGIGDKGPANFEAPNAGGYEMSYRIGSLNSATMRFKVGRDKVGLFRLDVLDDRRGLRVGSAERISILKPAFGKARHDIQMGIGFAGTRKTYSTGKNIPIDLFFRNVGTTRTEFDFHADFYWSPPTVVNEQGERMSISPIPVWLFEGPTKVSLEPGQTFGMSTRGLGLRNDKSGLSLVAPPRGKYRIGFLRTIYDHLKWQEHLISGTLEIEVGDRLNGVQVAKLLPGTSAHLDVLEAEAKHQPQDLDDPPELSVTDLPTNPATEETPLSESQSVEPPETDSESQHSNIPLDQVIWWEKADGLQVGFLLDSPHAPNQRVPNNSVAKYRILVRNTADKRLRFIVRLLPHQRADAPFLISSDDITESLAAANLPEKFRAKIAPPRFKHPEPAYVISLMPGEAIFVPNQSGLDDQSLFAGDAEKATRPSVSQFRPGMNWIVQPLQIQLFPSDGLANGTSLMGRYTITRISANGQARKEPASRMVAVKGGKILKPRIQLDVGTLTAAAERNAKFAKWGEVDKGLQCGIRLLNPKPSYVQGDMLEAELLWRNVSDAAISTPIPGRLDLYPMVHDPEGGYVPLDFGARFNIYPISLEMKPGEVRSLGIFKIKLVKEGTPSPQSNAEPAHLSVAPGVYSLSGSGGVSAKDGGSPTSAKVEFKVTSR